MELNKEIQIILLDYAQICIENNWTKEQMEIRSVYDTFRIQNIVENLSLSGVVKSFFCNNCHGERYRMLTPITYQCRDCESLQAK